MIHPSSRLPEPRLTSNALLRGLPEKECEQLADRVDFPNLDVRTELYSAHARIQAIYFPLTALASLVAEAETDTNVEISAVGNNGMLGIPVFLGARVSPTAAFCQVPGRMARLSTESFQELLPRAPTLHRRLALFSNAMLAELGQNAACNRTHDADQRCARWLLLTADRVGRDQFDLTHQFLAQMLGVRRATVSETARALAEAGLIRYRRGVMTVLDRPGLGDRACPCYERLRTELAHLFD